MDQDNANQQNTVPPIQPMQQMPQVAEPSSAPVMSQPTYTPGNIGQPMTVGKADGNSGSGWALLALGIIAVVVLALGGWFIFQTQPSTPLSPQTPVVTAVPTRVVTPTATATPTPPQDAQVMNLSKLSGSDEIADIEKDVLGTDLSKIDAELSDINKELPSL